MKVQVQEVGSCLRRLEIEVPAAEVDRELELAYRQLNSQVRVRGFRPGKIPRRILERHYWQRVHNDVLNRLIPDTCARILQEEQIEPLGLPKVEQIAELKENAPLRFTASVEVKPDVPLPTYAGLHLTKRIATVTEEQVEAELQRLQERHAEFIAVEGHAVAAQDYVVIDFDALLEGKPLADSQGRNYPLVLGRQQLHPDFEERLIGMRQGEERQFGITFAADHRDAKVAGKEVTFQVTVKEIKERHLPSLDDDFAKSVGEVETLQEWRQHLHDKLAEEAQQQATRELKREALEVLLAACPFEVPQVLVEERLQAMLWSLERQLQSQGVRMKGPEDMGEEMKANLRAVAVQGVREDLLLEKIADVEGLAITEEELNEELHRMASQTQQKVEAIKEEMIRNRTLEHLRRQLRLDRAMARLLEQSEIITVFLPPQTGEATQVEEAQA